MKRIVTIIAVTALIVSGLSGVGMCKDKVIVATDTNFKPFSFKNSKGVYTGFDVEF